MDESLRHVNPNPVLKANIISKTFFWWLNPLFKRGYQTPLEESDLYNVCPADASDYLGERLSVQWEKQLKRTKQGKEPSLLRALAVTFGFQYMLLGFVVALEEGTKVVQPLLLGGLIRYFTPNTTTSRTEAWLYAMGVAFCAIVLAISHHPYFFAVQRIGMRMRIACCSLMYKKCLRLSNRAMNESSVGQIVNLMSNDVNRFDQAVIFLHFLWVGPLQALAVLIILWNELGPSVLAGFVVLLLLIPVQGFMGKLFSKLRHKTAVHTDERVKVMNEIISGMRVIKMYCWEKPFGQLVEKIRANEIKHIDKARALQGVFFVPFFSCIGLSMLLIFGGRALLWRTSQEHDEEGESFMSAYRVFLTFGLFNAMKVPLTIFIPFSVQYIAEMMTVGARLQRFLLLEELEPPTASPAKDKTHNNSQDSKHKTTTTGADDVAADGVNGSSGVGVGGVGGNPDDKSSGADVSDVDIDDLDRPYLQLKHVTAKWDGTYTEANTLEDVSLRVGPGELMAVIGPVGSGKSSLLMTILGELQAQSGSVKSNGTVAYVSQQPWVFSGSVRQNIIFGSKYDKARYDKVIKVAALTRDLTIMPNGDSTLIGDRGVSLSGGQRARVSLARALYMDADIYLLDDPLSAVDSAVGRHIFEKCIVKYLKNKPRILVTHQVQFLPVAHSIFILKEGKINSQGSFIELSQSGVDFSELLKRSDEEEENEKQKNLCRQHSSGSHTLERAENLMTASHTSLHSMVEDYQPEPVQLPDEEERAQGSVGLSIYVDYFKAGTGILKFILLVLVNILAQACYVGSDWWLSRWSNQEEEKYAAMKEYGQFLRDHNITNMSSINANLTLPTVPDVDSYFNVYVFTAIIAAVFVFGLVRALLFFKIAVDAARSLHNAMFSRVLRTNISFFDNNPVGRILNRFSKDVGHMDDLLPVTFFDFIQCALLILGIVLVAGVVNPWVFIPTVPLAILFVYVRKYYLETSRSIKRLEGTLRSPVFSYLSASLQGLHTIRAMRMQKRFMAEFDSYQDHHTEAWYLFLATSRWLAVRLDMLCALFVIAVTTCSMLAADTMNAGLVGLSITYTMTLMGLFQWGVRQSAEVENQMISVERVLEYSRLPTEAELDSEPDKKPPASWPQIGAIHADNVNLQYSPSGPFVLKNLSFDIKGKEKIGIVGRTGAGKSSLLTTLFRMVEPKGTLTIDGINIQDIGLHDLRSKVSIIPQDPVLFTGSLRKNLDPFQEHSDDQLWNALEEVKLKEAIKENTEGLLMEVSEGGSNFSVGQRQLVCLARAVLGHTRILVIDEATANVDPITDELIQQTIRTKFRECTVLTIAHRLHTIIDSDRVMVLDAGTIVEMNSPIMLLSEKDGAFYSMVEQLGKAELENLTELARAAALRHGEQVPAIVNGKGPGKPAVVPATDGTLQDVTQSLETSSGDLDNTYKIEDIEASLQDTETPATEEKQQQQEEEEEESDSAEDMKRLLTDSSHSPHADGSSDLHKPAGPAAVVAEVDNDDVPDGTDESESLLKSEAGTSDIGDVVERRPLHKDTDSDSINV